MATDEESSSSSLILPGQASADTLTLDKLPLVVWLRNPVTGVIFRFHRGTDAAHPRDNDTITRCLKENYLPSSEAAARAQAVELAKLQGRALPPWAAEEAEGAEKPAQTAAKAR